jgi:membrane protease YdiL (CAAX protease family)
VEGPVAEPRDAPSEPAAGGARARRDVRTGAALLFAGFCFAAAGSALLQRAPDAPSTPLLAGLAAQALFLCTALAGARLAGPGLPRGLALGRPRLSPLELLALVAGFVCVSHALSVVLSLVNLRETGTLAELDRIVAAAEGPSRLLAFAAIGLAPAFGEELLFRGLVQQLALTRTGAVGALLASSLAFAAIHMDPVQSPAAFALGLYLGAAALVGASVWTASLCHGVNNSLSVLVPGLRLTLAPGSELAWAGALAAAGLVLLGLVARRSRSRPGARAQDPGREAPLQREAPPAD